MASNTFRAKQRRAAYWVLIHSKKNPQKAYIEKRLEKTQKQKAAQKAKSILSSIKDFFVKIWDIIKRISK